MEREKLLREIFVTSAKHHKIAALIYTTILFFGGILLHSYWAFGGNWFLAETTGTKHASPLTQEARIGTWIMVAFMVLACVLALGRAKIILTGIPQWIFATSCWIMVFCMLLGCYRNFSSLTYMWSMLVFGPIFLTLFISVFILALPTRQQNQKS